MIMPSPDDPNADDGKPFIAPDSTQKQEMKGQHQVTDKEAAGADGMDTGGSAPRDGEK
jgi:hypothetical protein